MIILISYRSKYESIVLTFNETTPLLILLLVLIFFITYSLYNKNSETEKETEIEMSEA